MKKLVLHKGIAIEGLVFCFLLIGAIYYVLLGLEPVLWIAGVLAALVLLRLVSLHITRRERVAARCSGVHLSKRALAITSSSLACISLLTLIVPCYLLSRFGWLPALLYGLLALTVGSTFEVSYEAFEVSEAAVVL